MTKRVIACLAALTLALSLLPVTALADELEVQTSDTTVGELGGESDALPTTTEGEGTDPIEAGGEAADPEETPVAQIGDTQYNTLDDAIEAAWESTEPVTITLLNDCVLTVGFINDPVTIKGNGHTVTIPAQEATKNLGELQINSALTFYNTKVNFKNETPDKEPITNAKDRAWSAVFNGSGVLTLDEGSVCTIEYSGFYTSPNAVINVLNGSSMTTSGTHYTAFMAEKYATLNVKNKSTFTVENTLRDKKPTNNGLTSFKINVEGSWFTVNNCDNQGLVRCWLTLDNSTADISGNTYGMTGYNNTDVLTMKNGSVLTMDDNSEAGIFLWGGTVEVQSGNTLSITNTGKRFVASDETDYRGVGAFVCDYYYSYYHADVTFADGATVEIVNNPLGGINSDGVMYLGKGTVIMNNGGTLIPYGGGIKNCGEITMADGVKLYNNHASTAGDDIYNTTSDSRVYKSDPAEYVQNTGSIILASVGSDWTLDDCNHRIDGWYLDGQESKNVPVEGGEEGETVTTLIRWNGKTTKDGLCLEGRDEYYKLYTPAEGAVTAPLALKAAHGYLNNNPPVIRDQYYTVTVKYVDEAGNTVAPSYSTGSLKSGTAYDVTAQDAIAIPGYTYKTTTGDPTTGTLNSDKVVTVVYTKTADIDDPDTPTDPGSDITDPDTPLDPAQPPKTGDRMPLFAALTTLSAAAIVLLSKKRKEA